MTIALAAAPSRISLSVIAPIPLCMISIFISSCWILPRDFSTASTEPPDSALSIILSFFNSFSLDISARFSSVTITYDSSI